MTATAILTPVRFCKMCKCETERKGNGACKPCAKAGDVKYSAKNREKINARTALWRTNNPDKAALDSAAWRAINPDKAREYSQAWRKNNPDKAKSLTTAWRAANVERNNAATIAWRKANPEKTKAKSAAWRAANPEAGRVHGQNRRARERNNGGALSIGLSEKLFILQKGKCPCCGLPLGKDYHMDHIAPLSRGGSNSDDNIQLLRRLCNSQKYTKHPVDFMQSRGFLL